MKTAELTGALLDYCVAKAVRSDVEIIDGRCVSRPMGWAWSPSTDWALAGPIIEGERLELRNEPDGQFSAMGDGCHATGTTMLIAAMRAYVASKFGEEVPDITG
jgi:hypothetical protein